MKVLSIDDSKSVHAFLDMCLPKPDFEITHLYSGEEAIAYLEKDEVSNFDLILLDWEMPGVTGPEVLEKFRSSGVSIPILMLTSKNKPEQISFSLFSS